MPVMTENKNEIKEAGKSRAESLIDKYNELLGGRKNFESYWQSLHDYFYVEAPDISKSYYPGTELDFNALWDATTLETSDVLASGFMNYLTPPTSKWFKLRHKDPKLASNKAINDYLEDVSDEIYHTLNKSNFYQSILPNYKASGVFGTSLLLEEEDYEEDARFYSLPIKQVCVVEDARGRVVEYYIEFEYTAYQAATRWGVEKLSTEMQDEVKQRAPDKKHKFLLFIGNRSIRMIERANRENMPIEARWIDIKAKKTIDEGGYNEFPAMCHRFDKRPFITWGFSPAMKALPFARILNAIAKTNLRAMMKHTDPPIALPENAFIMPFNSNPRAVNYYKKDAMDSSKDIFAFGNFGDPQVGVGAIEYYAMKVKSLMYSDVFKAFEELDKQMNNPEVMERINEKMAMLGPAVGRFTGEVLNPIIIRTIGILYRRGKLPQPPDELLDDPQYEIDYISQLAQAQKRSELNSLVTALTMTGQMAQFNPEVLDKIDPDRTVDETWSIVGAPIRVLRDDEEVKKIREARAQQNAKVQEMQMLGAGVQTAKVAAEADAKMAEATQRGRKNFE